MEIKEEDTKEPIPEQIIEEYEEPIRKGLFNRKKRFEKNKMKVDSKAFNRVFCFFLEETQRGDVIVINQKQLKLKNDKKNNSTYIQVQKRVRVYLQVNEMIPRADGTKIVFILRTGAGSFKALTISYLSEKYFSEHTTKDIQEWIEKEKGHALYLRSMNINERQLFMDTAKKILENAEETWEKLAPWAALIIIAIIMMGGFYMIASKMLAQNTAISHQFLQGSQTIANAMQNTWNSTLQVIRGG